MDPTHRGSGFMKSDLAAPLEAPLEVEEVPSHSPTPNAPIGQT